jgi:hypothetical protein
VPDTAVQDRRAVLQRWGAAALLCAGVGAAGGYAVADARTGPYELVGDVYSGELQMSFEGPDGQTMAVPLDVTWTAPSTGSHSGGRPDCLPPTGETYRGVRVTAVDVDAAGLRYGQVLVVHCD